MVVTTAGRDVEAKRFSAAGAVMKLQHEFRLVAKGFANGDWALEDDLIQEMNLAVLESEDGHKLRFYRVTGVNRAKNYLRDELRREMKSVEDIENKNDLPRLQTRVQSLKHDGFLEAIARVTRAESHRGRERLENLS
jgi:hypothetical protein